MRRQQSAALEPLPAALALQVPRLVSSLVRLQRRQVGEHAAASLAPDLVLGRHVVVELPFRVEGAFATVAPAIHRKMIGNNEKLASVLIRIQSPKKTIGSSS